MGLQWQQAKQGSPDFPLPRSIFQLLLGDPKAFPSKMRYVISPVCSGSTLGALTGWMENLQRKVPGRHFDQMLEPPQLVLSTQRSSSSTPGSLRMFALLTLSLRVSQATLRRKLISATCIHDLILLVTAQCSIGEGELSSTISAPSSQQSSTNPALLPHHSAC